MAARLGETRLRGNAQPAVFNRQVAMYLAKHVGGWSTTQIGQFYNGRDHSTVCHAVKKIEILRNAHPQVEELIAALKGEIGSEVQNNSAAAHNAVEHPGLQAGAMLVTDEFLGLLIDRLLVRLPRASPRMGAREVERSVTNS